MKQGARLLVRADGGPAIGSGHLMRCLALSQAWQELGGEVVYAQAGEGALLARLADEGIAVVRITATAGSEEDARLTVEAARAARADWVVVDGYVFGPEYTSAIRAAGFPLLVLDDYAHAARYDADVLLNQNISATASLYPGIAATTRLLLGTRFALLRREFRAFSATPRACPDLARKILVTLGGADPENFSAFVLRALGRVALDLEVRALVGESNPHGVALAEIADGAGPKFEIVKNARDMPEQIAWADLVVTGGGSTCWELCLLGAPSVILVLAENQRGVGAGLDAAGAAESLGWFRDLTEERLALSVEHLARDPTRRRAMSSAGPATVDGRGALRVIEAMRDVAPQIEK